MTDITARHPEPPVDCLQATQRLREQLVDLQPVMPTVTIITGQPLGASHRRSTQIGRS